MQKARRLVIFHKKEESSSSKDGQFLWLSVKKQTPKNLRSFFLLPGCFGYTPATHMAPGESYETDQRQGWRRPLHQAARWERRSCLRRLLVAQADPERLEGSEKWGGSFFFFACYLFFLKCGFCCLRGAVVGKQDLLCQTMCSKPREDRNWHALKRFYASPNQSPTC